MNETYLDNAASAPLRPEAREAITRALDSGPGNPSSAHAAGRRLRRILGDAREAVAALVGARPDEVVFTSGTSESNRLAVRGLLGAAGGRGPLVLTDAAHDGLRALGRALAGEGVDVRTAPCDDAGHVRPADVATRAGDAVAVVAIGAVQSVTGATQPVDAVIAALPSALVHVDAAQSVGRVPVAFNDTHTATLAFSAHKIGGPHGIGALVIRTDVALHRTDGDMSQERGRRGGTEAVALAAGFGAAARAAGGEAARRAADDHAHLRPLHAWLREEPLASLVTRAPAAPGLALVRLHGCPGDAVLAALDERGVRVSTGTACASGASVPPHVLTAAGWSPRDAAECVRISLGWRSTEDDIESLVDALRDVLPRVRAAFRDGEKKLA